MYSLITREFNSQLMSPHGMHRVADGMKDADWSLPTHVSARNASGIIHPDVAYDLISQLMSPHGMHHYK